MAAPRRRFEVVAPDWGQAHLTSDAVVAFVDDELSAAAHARAVQHLADCPDCTAEIAAQGQARSALRAAHAPELSSSLLHSLRAIPSDAELPGPPAGFAVGADGGFVQALRPQPVPRSRRFAAGLAVSGLAIGALALTAPGLSTEEPAAERGVFGGTVLDARLQVPAAEPVAALPVSTEQGQEPGFDAVIQRLDAIPAACSASSR